MLLGETEACGNQSVHHNLPEVLMVFGLHLLSFSDTKAEFLSVSATEMEGTKYQV